MLTNWEIRIKVNIVQEKNLYITLIITREYNKISIGHWFFFGKYLLYLLTIEYDILYPKKFCYIAL